MPRANRHFLSGHIWHITHRCHQRKFLLKFARDRRRYLHWVFEARRRFGLCVLITLSHPITFIFWSKTPGQRSLPRACSLSPGVLGRNTTGAKGGKGRSGRIATTPQPLKQTSICIAVWCTSI